MAKDLEKNPETAFEPDDLRSRPIITFLVVLALVCVLVAFALRGMYNFLDADARAHEPRLSPLAPASNPDTRSLNKAEVKAEIKKVFPDPRLEDDERGELKSVLLDEEQKLNSYGWVDEKAGVVRVPIERAMQLVVQRGLTTTPRAGIAPAAAGKE
jgi:hypothetical protein